MKTTFTARIEIDGDERPEFVDAEVTCQADGEGLPQFVGIRVEGLAVPPSHASKSSLLRAYLKHRFEAGCL